MIFSLVSFSLLQILSYQTFTNLMSRTLYFLLLCLKCDCKNTSLWIAARPDKHMTCINIHTQPLTFLFQPYSHPFPKIQPGNLLSSQLLAYFIQIPSHFKVGKAAAGTGVLCTIFRDGPETPTPSTGELRMNILRYLLGTENI